MAVAVLAVAAVASTAVTVYGQYKAGKAAAEAANANAAFYREQSEFARRAMMREYSVYNDKAADFTGETISQFGKGNVALTGSPLSLLGTMFARQESERQAILEGGEFQVREARLKAEASQREASNIRKAARLQMFGSVMSGVTQVAGAFAGGAKASSSGSNWMSSSTSSGGAASTGSSFRSSLGFGNYGF